jgi:ankyrin repeat protein
MFCSDKSYLKIILVLVLLTNIGKLSSQVSLIDTSSYMPYLWFESEQNILNYNLMIAASKGYASEIDRLIGKGAEVDCLTSEGTTPLIFAVSGNKTDAVKSLLKYSPDVNIFTKRSETPLLIAVKNGNIDIAEALIRDSADINISDKYSATPLHYASIYGYFYMVDLLLYYEVVNDRKTLDGTTPLMAAVWAGYTDVADLLIQNSADIEAKDNAGFTPFLIAAQIGDTVSMELLLKKGVNLYEFNKYNYNALDLCIKFNHKEAIEYLLRKGDKWISKGELIVDPYAVAAKYMRNEIINILEQNKIPRTNRLGFDQVSISVSENLSIHDNFTGAKLSFKEPSLNGGIAVGCDFKIAYTRVLIKENESLFYQYMYKRSVVYAGLFKDFAVTDNAAKGNWELSTSLSVAYTFGNKFKGTNITPDKSVMLIPAVNLKWTIGNIGVSGGLEYMKTEFYKNGPFWLRIGCSYNLFFDKVRAPGKVIKWN